MCSTIAWVCDSVSADGNAHAIGVFLGWSVLANNFGVGDVFDTIKRDVFEVNGSESVGAVDAILGWR